MHFKYILLRKFTTESSFAVYFLHYYSNSLNSILGHDFVQKKYHEPVRYKRTSSAFYKVVRLHCSDVLHKFIATCVKCLRDFV